MKFSLNKKAISFILFISFVFPLYSGFLDRVTAVVPKPTAKVKRFQIKSITFKDITFEFDIEVYNPYLVKLKLDGVLLKFIVEGIQLFQAQTSKGFTIEPKRAADNIFTATLKYDDIIKAVKSFRQKDLLNCKIDTTILIPLPQIKGLPPRISFNYVLEKDIPAIEPDVNIRNFNVVVPSVAEISKTMQKQAITNVSPASVYNMYDSMIKGKPAPEVIDPDKLDLKFTISFDLEIQNKAKSALDLSPVNYTFDIEGSRLIDGSSQKVEKTPTMTRLHVENEFSSRSLTKGVITAFKQGRGSFKVSGETGLILPAKLSKMPIPLSFEESGKFKLR